MSNIINLNKTHSQVFDNPQRHCFVKLVQILRLKILSAATFDFRRILIKTGSEDTAAAIGPSRHRKSCRLVRVTVQSTTREEQRSGLIEPGSRLIFRVRSRVVTSGPG